MGLVLAACRECGVEQRRGVGAAPDVAVADGRRLAVRAGEGDLPGAEPPVGVRDRPCRLLAGEPAEVRAADADAGQDPAVVLHGPMRTGRRRRCRRRAGRPGRTRRRSGGRATVDAEVVRWARRRSRRPRRAASARHRRRARGSATCPLTRCRSARPTQTPRRSSHRPARARRRPAVRRAGRGPRARGRRRAARRRVWRRWQPGRLRSWAGRSSDAHARSAGSGPRAWQPRHSRACAPICHGDVWPGAQDCDASRPSNVARRPRTSECRHAASSRVVAAAWSSSASNQMGAPITSSTSPRSRDGRRRRSMIDIWWISSLTGTTGVRPSTAMSPARP